MRIGIITFHKALNHGAVLQTYALYRSVKKLAGAGDDVFILDHVGAQMKKQYALLHLSYNMSFNIKQGIILPAKILKKNRFNRFLKSNLRFKAVISDDDRMITGSDQVWNLDIMYGDKAYFLDFVKDPHHKNSYAASFGTESIADKYIDEITRLLNDFNKISVREETGRQIIKEIINRDVPVVLDPTMLLGMDEWKEVAEKRRLRKDYILLYALAGSDALFSFTNALSGKTSLQIICVANENAKKTQKFRYKNFAGPCEWISLMMNASYIVTDSFHGTAFAINFKKPFFVELSPALLAVSSRLDNLLGMFGLSERKIVDGKNNNMDKTIDYDRVDITLEKEKEKSIGYLKSIIEEMFD